MPTCGQNDFCGYGRTDYGFVYQRCTCPMDYNCVVNSNDDLVNVNELFYNGTMYPAKCKSFHNNFSEM